MEHEVLSDLVLLQTVYHIGPPWFTYQIGRYAGSAVIRHPSLMNWSLPRYKLLSGGFLSTILTIQHKKFEDYTL